MCNIFLSIYLISGKISLFRYSVCIFPMSLSVNLYLHLCICLYLFSGCTFSILPFFSTSPWKVPFFFSTSSPSSPLPLSLTILFLPRRVPSFSLLRLHSCILCSVPPSLPFSPLSPKEVTLLVRSLPLFPHFYLPAFSTRPSFSRLHFSLHPTSLPSLSPSLLSLSLPPSLPPPHLLSFPQVFDWEFPISVKRVQKRSFLHYC